MTIGRFGLGAVLAIALLVLSGIPAVAAPPAIDVYAKPDDSAPIEVTIPPEATSASVPVHIYLGDWLPRGRDPQFALSPLVLQDEPLARLPAAPSITMLVEGRDVTDGGFHPTVRSTWPAELRFDGFDTFGTFEGDLVAAIGDTPFAGRPVVRVVIRRYPAADLVLGALDDREPLTATTAEPAIDVPLEVRNTTLGTARGVHVAVGPLRAADGTEAGVEIVDDAIPATLDALAMASRTIRVSMRAPGMYEGTVTLSWAGTRREVPVRVERVVPPAGVTVLAAEGISGEIPWCADLAVARPEPCATDAIWLSVHETAGREVTIDAPTLRSLARRADGSEVAVPDVAMAASLDCVGGSADGADESMGDTATAGTIVAPAAVDASGIQTCGRASYDPAARRLTLGPGAIARMRLQLAGDLVPGEYVARLALASASSPAIETEASLALRLPAGLALLAFLIGCVVALPVRRPLTIARRQIRQRARIAALRARLDRALRAAPDHEARTITVRAQATVDRALESIRTTRQGGRRADRHLEDLEARVDGLERWLAVWTASARLPGAVQDRIRSRMVTVARTFEQDERLTDLDRRTLDEVDSLGEQLGTATAARSSSVRDPRLRRSDDPSLAEDWQWMLRGAARRVRWDIAIETVVLVVLTTLAGLVFVWAPDATWGDPGDLIVAIAWSVAVVIVASAALTGLAAIRSQLGRPEAL